MHLLSPDHLVHNPRIALDNLHDLGADILVYIIGNGDALLPVAAKFHSSIYGLQQASFVDTGYDEVALVDSFRAFGRGTDTNGGEGVSYAGEETAFFGQRPTVADYSECVHLQAVVIMEP